MIVQEIGCPGMANRLVLMLCALLFTMGGCVHPAGPPILSPAVSPEEVLAITTHHFPADSVFVARARLGVASGRGRFATGIAISVRTPAFLRLEALSLLGLPDLVLTVNDQLTKFYNVREGKFYISSEARDLSQFLPIHLTSAEVVSLVMGICPTVEQGEVLTGEMAQGSYVLGFHKGNRLTRSIRLEPGSFNMVRLEKYTEEGLAYQADFADYRKTGDHSLPGQIIVTFRRPEKLVVTLRLSSGEILPCTEVNFDQSVPEGMTPIDLDAGSDE